MAEPSAVTGAYPAVLDGAIPVLSIEPAQGVDQVRLPENLPVSETFAARMVDTRTLEYLGTVIAGGRPFLPSQLKSPPPDGMLLVEGWIAGMIASPSCPQAPVGANGAVGCGPAAYLSDAAQPALESYLGTPAFAVRVQNGAYPLFAPSWDSTQTRGVPERATFLVQAIYSAPFCTGVTCAGGPAEFDHWAIVARLDPWPGLRSSP